MNLIKHRLLTASAFESKVKLKWERCRTTIISLMYNDFCDQSYVVDVCMEPIFWFVNNFTTVLGPLFVVAVCCLTCSIVTICYWIGVPYYWKKSPPFTIFLMVIGHWLLVNNVFHYFMAVRTPPGYPPENKLITEAVSICKKCISPKPPRTHHCSICNRCILKMDHHCPWINNCVGYSNHRYFYLYMCYTIIGVCFIIICGFNIVMDGLWYANYDEELEGHPVTFDHTGAIIPMAEMSLNVSDVQFGDLENDADATLKLTLWERRSLIYMVLINVGVLVALGGLLWLHTQLISRGETCIESHINKSETKRLAAVNKIYVNPYNFGRKKNWKLFLGVARGRTWFRYVILPSAHIPEGDGLSWMTVHDTDLTDWP